MKKSSIAALLLTLSPLTAYAATYYANLGAGVSYPAYGSSTNGNSNSVVYAPNAPLSPTTGQFQLSSVNWDSDFQSIYNANFALGAQLTPHYRVEGEFFYQRLNRNVSGNYNWIQQNALMGDSFTNSTGVPLGTATGVANVYSLMANAYYDFVNRTKLTPTVGAGVGLAYLWSAGINTNGFLTTNDTDNPALSQTVPTIGRVPSLSSKAFAWQLKAGFSYLPNDDVALVFMYRLFGTTSFNPHSSGIIVNPGMGAATASFSIPGTGAARGLLTNSFDISLRYYFL